MKTPAPWLVILTQDGGRRCLVNLAQVEVIEDRFESSEITFASGTTLVVEETLEKIFAMAAAGV